MSATLRVLLVEDSADDAQLILQELQRGGHTVDSERVETAATMREALHRRRWDIILADWTLPTFSAPAALDLLHQSGVDIPFVIVSGTIMEEAAIDAIRAGARDYLLKDRLGRLRAVVDREVNDALQREALRQAENARRESDARFRRLTESGLFGMFVGEAGGKITEANETILEMTGYSRDDVDTGKMSWKNMTPPEWLHANATASAELHAKGIARPWEKEYLRKDGSRVPVLVGVAALDGAQYISISIDLSDRKRSESARLAAERALQQSEVQLRHAQKMDAVGRLAGGVAHDFNNMLSVILSYAEILAGEMDPEEPMRADIEEIRAAAERAAGLTRQLLLFSRQEVVQPRVIDLHEVLVGLAKMLRRLVGEDVELTLVPPPSRARVRADPGHIEQVIINLVVNARDAMPTGGKLTIETTTVFLDEEFTRTHPPAQAGEHVMMAVSDSGVGMDAATQARIFEPFFTTKAVGKGTGLGLSTAFGIAQQSGGTIWAYSEVGKGSTFKVYLPRVDSAVEPMQGTPHPATVRGTETILLVEDEDQVRAIAQNVLRRNGYHVLSARNAAEALALCEAHDGPIDLLLSDVVMPQMSGPELAKKLSAMRPDAAVIFMSGYTDDSIVRHGVLEMKLPYLQKPFTPTSLGERVRQTLDDAKRKRKS